MINMNEKNIITAKQMMKATIGGENKEEINKEIKKINEGNGSISPQEMREYLLREPSNVMDGKMDLYDEYARQFGGMLIKLMEEKPHLAKSTDWLLTAKKELVLDSRMEDWLTVLSAKWSEGAVRYALNKPMSQ